MSSAKISAIVFRPKSFSCHIVAFCTSWWPWLAYLRQNCVILDGPTTAWGISFTLVHILYHTSCYIWPTLSVIIGIWGIFMSSNHENNVHPCRHNAVGSPWCYTVRCSEGISCVYRYSCKPGGILCNNDIHDLQYVQYAWVHFYMVQYICIYVTHFFHLPGY